jgi:hypothetical protein
VLAVAVATPVSSLSIEFPSLLLRDVDTTSSQPVGSCSLRHEHDYLLLWRLSLLSAGSNCLSER